MKKNILCLCLCIFLAVAIHGEKLSLKVNAGGTYLMGGDYNKGIEGFRNYELEVLGPTETFVDEMKKLGLGYQFSAELFYSLNLNMAVGIEAGYLGASVTSHLERTWHNFKWTINPTLSAIPVTLNIHYFKPLGKKMKLHAMAGVGAFISSLNYVYNIDDSVNPYYGTWTPDTKTVFGAKVGIGVEYPLAGKIFLTFDMTGRYASVTGFTGAWEGIYNGVPKSGSGTLFSYDYVDSTGSWPVFGIYESAPSGAHIQNVKEATFSLSGVSLLFGIKINL
jgi:hypothetical protein